MVPPVGKRSNNWNDPDSPDRSSSFRTTRWTVVLAAGESDSADCREALTALCQSYWFPLYAYARGCGWSPEDAQDTTQAFFSYLLENNALGSANPERGRFRWFLLKSFQNFMRNELVRMRAQKRGGRISFVSWDALDAEQRYASEPTEEATPDQVYDRRWARTLMERALDLLVDEFARSTRRELFIRLRVYLVGDPGEASYATVAAELGLSPVAVKVTVHRLRRRYRDLIRSEISQTVPRPDDVEAELRHLVLALGTQ